MRFFTYRQLTSLIIPASCIVAALILACSPALANGPCPPKAAGITQVDLSTGDFEGMRPTSYGNVLFCGNYKAGDSFFHFENSSQVFTTQFTEFSAPGDYGLHMNLDFDTYGAMAVDLDLTDSEPVELISRTLGNSSISNCLDLFESDLFSAIEEIHDYFNGVLEYGLGTPGELDELTLMREIVMQYVFGPHLIEDCLPVEMNTCIGASENFDQCDDCCIDEKGGRDEDCLRDKRETDSTIYGLIDGIISAVLGLNSKAEVTYAACINSSADVRTECGRGCGASF